MQISIKGIDHAIKTISKYADMERKMMDFAWRLCEVGRQVAAAGYGGNASVTAERTQSGAKVNIDGEGVLFIEFGTGDAAGIHAAQYDAVPACVYPGSWSEQHAQQYSRFGVWWFGGRWMYETPPHPYTFDAYQAMVEAIPRVASEVFK